MKSFNRKYRLRDCNSRLRPWYLYFVCLLGVAGVLVFQLFVPPILGLADNGDFQREIGVFGYGPAPQVPPLTWAYVAPTYTLQQERVVRRPEYEQLTSDYLFVAFAVAISRFFPGDGTLPIILVGLIHAGGLIAALARLLFFTRHFRGKLVLWIGTALVLTDAGYAAYANSFFAEAASGIFGVWFIAEAVRACDRKRVGLAFIVSAVLLLCGKAQNAPLAVPMAIYAVLVDQQFAVWPKIATAATIVMAAVITLSSVGVRPKLDTSYNMLFSAILPESRDPRGDLRALRMDPELVRFKGTLAWSPNSGLYAEEVRKAMHATGPVQIAMFYVTRPKRLWRHITTLFPIATQIRPESCGNFEVSAGRPPGARATSFSFWTIVHERWLGRITKFLLFGLTGMMIACVAVSKFSKKWRFAPVMALLPALSLIAFLTAAFGDASEPIKHQYLFNLMLDACLVSALAALTSFVPGFDIKSKRET
jgi:hypothetical protein